MNFFADTNIPIGYTVIHDKWHPQSKRFINNNENPIFWSNLVKKEYNDRLDNIWDLIDKYLNSIITILKINDKDFDNYSSFERFILKRTRYCELDDIKMTEAISKIDTSCLGIIEFKVCNSLTN